MSILEKFLGSKKESSTVEAPPCPHTVLLPRWDSVADMGVEEKATGFTCESCHEAFTPEEARNLQASSLTDKLVGQAAE
jgi:hypothetical protein